MNKLLTIAILFLAVSLSASGDSNDDFGMPKTIAFVIEKTGETELDKALLSFSKLIQEEDFKIPEDAAAEMKTELVEKGLLVNGFGNLTTLQAYLKKQWGDYKSELELIQLIKMMGDFSPVIIGGTIEGSYKLDDLKDEVKRSVVLQLMILSICV